MRRVVLPELHGFTCGDLLAIVAFQAGILFVDHGKDGRDVLDIGDAVGVETPHYSLYTVGCLHDGFRLHLEIPYFDDGGVGRYQGDLIQLFRCEKFVADLDDTFFAVFLAFQVGSKQNHVFKRFQFQDADNLKHGVGGDMIDDGAVFDGRHLKFFNLFVFHDVLFFYSNDR